MLSPVAVQVDANTFKYNLLTVERVDRRWLVILSVSREPTRDDRWTHGEDRLFESKFLDTILDDGALESNDTSHLVRGYHMCQL